MLQIDIDFFMHRQNSMDSLQTESVTMASALGGKQHRLEFYNHPCVFSVHATRFSTFVRMLPETCALTTSSVLHALSAHVPLDADRLLQTEFQKQLYCLACITPHPALSIVHAQLQVVSFALVAFNDKQLAIDILARSRVNVSKRCYGAILKKLEVIL